MGLGGKRYSTLTAAFGSLLWLVGYCNNGQPCRDSRVCPDNQKSHGVKITASKDVTFEKG